MVSGGRRLMLPNALRPAVLTTLATIGCSLQAELLPNHRVERVERESATEPSCCLVPLSEAVQREQPHLVVARVVVRLQAHGLVERRPSHHAGARAGPAASGDGRPVDARQGRAPAAVQLLWLLPNGAAHAEQLRTKGRGNTMVPSRSRAQPARPGDPAAARPAVSSLWLPVWEDRRPPCVW